MELKPAHLKRYWGLTRLLLKYGHTADREIPALPDAPELPATQEEKDRGEELAKDLEALGPTFIKLGQLLSSRGALIPAAYAQALERLQDSAEPFPVEEVEQIITDELGVRISKGFEQFDPEPLASASLGQVHRARLRSGRDVVVKVQRPHIRQRIADDLDAFDEIARLLEKYTTVGERMELRALIEEFRKTIFEELDYRREARNLERLAENLARFEKIVIPRPVVDYTTDRVLTMDFVPGVKITKSGPLTALEVDGEALAEELFQAYLQQILVDGFFHADPHPGNVLLTPDGRIGLIDVGMVYRLSPRLQDSLIKLVLAIADGRGEEAADQALTIAERTEDANEKDFRRRVAGLVADYAGSGLAATPVGMVFLEIVRNSVECGIKLPTETAMIGKTLLNLDAIGRALAPTFNPTTSIRRNSAQLMQQRMLKSLSPATFFNSILELRDFTDRLPGRLNRILDATANNKLGFKLDTGIDQVQLTRGFQKVANRITMGLVLAALIVGAAMLMRVETTFRILGYPGLAILLFLFAVGSGILLLLNIATQDRRDLKAKPTERAQVRS